MTYQDPTPLSKDDAKAIFAKGSPREICGALVSLAFYEEEASWVEQQCITFARHKSPQVREVAAICFGHLARIHKRIDLEKVLPILQELTQDPEQDVAGVAEDALGDIKMFIAVNH